MAPTEKKVAEKKPGEKKAGAKKPKEAPKTSKGLPAVPESVLKHRKRRILARKHAVQSRIKKRTDNIKKRKDIFQRAEQYVKEYRIKERDEIRLALQAKNRGNYYVPGDAKLAFVIRIRGINQVVHPTAPVLLTKSGPLGTLIRSRGFKN